MCGVCVHMCVCVGMSVCVCVCVVTAICSTQGLSNDLKRAPDTLEDLKFVLIVITKIRAMSLDVELQYRYSH